jgi:hypothetical protein
MFYNALKRKGKADDVAGAIFAWPSALSSAYVVCSIDCAASHRERHANGGVDPQQHERKHVEAGRWHTHRDVAIPIPAIRP